MTDVKIWSRTYPALLLYSGERVDGYTVDVNESDKLIEHYIGSKLAEWLEANPQPIDPKYYGDWQEKMDAKYKDACRQFRMQFDSMPSDFLVWKQCDA